MKFVRNLAALLVSDALSKLVSFAAIAYLARVLGPEGLGAFAWAQSAAIMIGTVANFGFSEYGILKIAPDRGNDHISKIVSRIIGFRGALGVGTIALYMVAALWLAPSPSQADLLLWSAFLIVSSVLAFEWFFTAVEDQVVPGIVRIVSRSLYLGASVLLVRGPADVLVALLVFIASEILLQGCLVLVARRRYQFPIRPTLADWRMTLHEVAPLAIYTLSSAVFAQADVVILGFLLPSDQVGLYAGAVRVMWLVLSIKYLVAQLLYPKIVRHQATSAEALGRYLTSLHTFAVVAALVGVTFMAAFASPLVTLILGPQYAASGWIFAVLLVGIFGELCWIALPYAVIAVDRKAYSVIMLSIGSAKVVVVAGLALTGQVLAAAAGAAAINALLFIWCVLFLWRRSVPLHLARLLAMPLGAVVIAAVVLVSSEWPSVLLWAVMLLLSGAVLAPTEWSRWRRHTLRSDLVTVTD